MDINKILKMAKINTAPGAERHIEDYLKNELSEFADEIYADKCGNLIARFGNGGKWLRIFLL